MPLYAVRVLDVVGNPVDGYDVNASQGAGEVYIQPQEFAEAAALAEGQRPGPDLWNPVLTAALIDAGLLGPNADEAVVNGGLLIHHHIEATELTISELEQAFAYVNLEREAPDRFIGLVPTDPHEVDRVRTRAEQNIPNADWIVDIIADYRPFLNLTVAVQQLPFGKHLPTFWETRLLIPASQGNMTPDEHELAIELGFGEGVISATVVLLNAGRPEGEDYFEWPLAEWQDEPLLGYDMLTSLKLISTKRQLAEILVALDQAMERS